MNFFISVFLAIFFTIIINNPAFGGFINREYNILEKLEVIPDHEVMPDINFFDKENNPINFDKFEGKFLIINFWASWSLDSNNEIKLLDKLQREFRKLPIEIIPIAINQKNAEITDKYYQLHEIKNLNIYYDKKSDLYNNLSFYSLPITIFVNKSGRIVGLIKGLVNWESQDVKKWLKNAIDN